MARFRLRERLSALSRELITLYYAYRDPRTPWYSRVLIFLTLAYALSPIDLIPDFIPVIGLLDDLLIVPLGIYLSMKTIPKKVLSECRERSKAPIDDPRLRRIGICLVIGLWALVLGFGALMLLRKL